MKRNVTLIIGNEPVDLGDQSFILFNWTMEDLTNPTAVKNSYTQQISLDGTPQNNRIFGNCYRIDRSIIIGSGIYTGYGFDPTRKTPFEILSESSEVLISGYVKMDSVQVSGASVKYNITLYGGLGSFFYSLTYDSAGNKRTLADLDYLGKADPDTELDFRINASAVNYAWSWLNFPFLSGVWRVINFAPCYNGIPDGDFSADKAFAMTGSSCIPSYVTVDDVEYKGKDGLFTIVDLPKEYDEWAMKDHRSYLQRPILSVEAFIKAICNPSNNGGYTVDVSDLADGDGVPIYRDMWITLPMLTEMSLAKSEIESNLLFSSPLTASSAIATYTVETEAALPSNASVSLKANFKLAMEIAGSVTSELYTSYNDNAKPLSTAYGSVIFLQLIAYSGNAIVGGSDIACVSSLPNTDGSYMSPESLAKLLGFSPRWTEGQYGALYTGAFVYDDIHVLEDVIKLSAEGISVDKFVLYADTYKAVGTPGAYWGGPNSLPYLLGAGGEEYQCLDWQVTSDQSDELTVEIPNGNIRSGAIVSKSVLLNSEYTPADYLLSFCKMFGFYFLYDNMNKSIKIVSRNTMYGYNDGVEYINLTDRIDLSKGIEIVPFVSESKWYDFILESSGGEFYEKYKSLYGVEYGMQRLDTGYDFDTDNINLVENNVFRQAVTSLENTPYFNRIMDKGVSYASVFVDKGATYTLWDSDGNSKEFDIGNISDNAVVTYYNASYPGYDFSGMEKLQFHDDENKAIDGANVLIYYTGLMQLSDIFHLSDDKAEMLSLNEGKPCWYLENASHYDVNAIKVPVFSRYRKEGSVITRSLDFGRVRELDIPTLTYDDEQITQYELYWRSYLASRFDKDTKILRCKVDLSGLDVGQELMRKFFWYEGSLWVLNKIENYSFTTFDPAECEFIQVRDNLNYITGQILK